MEETNVLEEMEDTIVTDILKKEYKDLSESEKSRIVKELSVFALSDEWAELQKELEDNAKDIENKIVTAIEDRECSTEAQELVASQFDRDTHTAEYMKHTADNLGDSFGATVFKNKLIAGSVQYKKSYLDKMEPGYDAPCYTKLDMMRNDRLLCLSVKEWLRQTMNSYEKVTEAPEVKSAY